MSKQVKQTFPGSYPDDMRQQLWPLCCGCTIISGFKKAHTLTDEELLKEINATLATIPDFQVFAGEHMHPALTMCVLNQSQSASAKITGALKAAGFVQFGSASLWSGTGTFWLRDTKNSFETLPISKGKANTVTLVGHNGGPALDEGTKGAAAVA